MEHQAVFFNCYLSPLWLSQTFDTVANTTYTVGFLIKVDDWGSDGPAGVNVSATGNAALQVSNLKLEDGWVPETYQFTAAGPSTTLTFLTGSGAGSRIFLDAVTVTAAPEPATMGLLAIGGLAALVRRRCA